MNRAGKVLRVAVTGLSLLLCAIIIGLWIFSWYAPGCVSGDVPAISSVNPWRGGDSNSALNVYSMRGGVDVRYFWRSRASNPDGVTSWQISRVTNPVRLSESASPPSLGNRLGFFWINGTPGGSYFRPDANGPAHFVAIGFPYWALTLLMLTVPIWQLFLLRGRRRRQLAGMCPVCGYDLRATSDRCPECGTVTSQSQ